MSLFDVIKYPVTAQTFVGDNWYELPKGIRHEWKRLNGGSNTLFDHLDDYSGSLSLLRQAIRDWEE